MKDIILNKIIRFCLRRCCVDAVTARMAIHKLSKGEVQYYLDEYDEAETYWKTHKNPFKRY
jgi:hypothetical protein